ncbi:tetratricopeptide repeat protein 6 [Camelus ferus]|nr:tetratricopeptide repeat protein 6 [Camelus ferus]
MSHGILPEQKKFLLKVPLYERQFRCPSLPLYLYFDKFAQSKGGIPKNSDPRTWALEMFSKPKREKTTTREKVVKISVDKDFPERVKKPLKLELSDCLKSDLPPEVVRHYESEVKILTEEINSLIELSPIQQALIYSFCENHDKAMQVLDGITLSRPDITMCALLAKAQMKAKRNKAVDSFTKAVKANPDFAEGFYQRGLCKVKLHKDSSILDFNRAITLNPKHYQAYLSRVAFYGLKGRYSKAILNCNEAIKIYPRSVHAYICRGVLKYYNKTYKLAITDLTTAINMNKTSYIAFYNRALCYTKISELRMDFKQAALISKTSVSLCQATAMCYHRNKEFEEAVNFFTWALKIDPCFLDAYIGRGNSYMEYGHEEATRQAQKDFVKALHFNPVCTKARIYLSYNLQLVLRHEIGDKYYSQMLNTHTVILQINTTAEFITNRGVIHEFMGQQQNAMRDYQAAISLNPTYSLAYFNAGNIYFHHRQFSQASDYFSKALKFDPENECATMNRAIANTILKKYEEAKEDFACVVESCPFWAAVYFNRAYFYCCLKQYELAEEDLSKALSLKPNDALVYNFRAEVRGKIGLIEEAMADYNQALDLQENTSVV